MEKETKTQKPDSKGKRIVKAIFNTIINILIVVVLITSIIIAAMALTSKDSGVSTIFGYTIQPIQSDSMKGSSPDGYEGGNFEKGDLMIAKATGFNADAEYDLGDIVTYISDETDANGRPMLIVHRIVDVVEREDGVYTYQTWGDNREVAKVADQLKSEDYIKASSIASVFYSADTKGTILKGWGAPLDYIKTQQGFFFVVLLPMIIFFMYALIRVVISAMNYKNTKSEEEKKKAVDEAVAAVLAEKAPAAEPASAGMSAEELEQFRQFQEFQKMQKAQQQAESSDTPEE